MNFEQIIIPIVVSALTFAAAWYWHSKSCVALAKAMAAKEVQDLKDQVATLSAEIGLVRQAIVPISTAFQAILVKELTHFHTPVMDALMVKIGPPYLLTDVEERELIAALDERMKAEGDLMTESERDAAAMLPMVIKRVKAEAALGITDLQVQLVALPAMPSK